MHTTSSASSTNDHSSGGGPAKRCFYQVLGVEPSAPPDELRKAYQKRALQCHPDKQGGSVSPPEFHELQRAWETLRDPKSRSEYDRERRKEEADVVVSDEVRVSEMRQCDENSYEQECRCGDVYTITAEELRDGFNVVSCPSCGLYIMVHPD